MAITTTEVLAIEQRGPVRVLTLNRPQVRNAINRELATAVGRALDDADAAPHCRAAVLTGAGPVFCAGSDLKERAAGRSVMPKDESWGFAGIVRHAIDVPVIAAVNGDCFGGGLEIALACDLIVACDDARLGLPEVGRGRIAGAGGLVRLPHVIPPRIAAEMALTGRALSAAEALRWGLVNRCVPRGDLITTAVTLAEEIAANAPLAVSSAKRILRASMEQQAEAAWAVNGREMESIASTADAREGAAAFAEKRTPHWTGT